MIQRFMTTAKFAANVNVKSFINSIAGLKENASNVVPTQTISEFCHLYGNWSMQDKQEAMVVLSSELNVKDDVVQEIILNKGHHMHRKLRTALVPMYMTLFEQIIAQRCDGMSFMVKFRQDLNLILRNTEDKQDLQHMSLNLKDLLAKWFSVRLLDMQRIQFNTASGALLEKIVQYEAVHPVGTIYELKRRLGLGRRCFCFFHPCMPNEPLVFVHVALVQGIAAKMEDLIVTEYPDTAIFYSISSTQPGLQGIDLGNHLIKQVASFLQREEPHIKTFSTLSPIPGFLPWLHRQDVQQLEIQIGISNLAQQLDILQTDNWHLQTKNHTLKSTMIQLAGHYLLHEKRRGKAFCSVANFHIRNGAILERINWLANPTPKGLAQSAGMMVNYKYDLKLIQENNANYIHKGIIPTGF